MLFWILGCLGAADRTITDFHDDAGFLVAQMRVRSCVAGDACAIWDARLFDDGPQAVALGRPCVSGCEPAARDLRVLGRAFDGVTGVLAGDNPLLVALDALDCVGPSACHALLDGDALRVTSRRSGESVQVALPERTTTD